MAINESKLLVKKIHTDIAPFNEDLAWQTQPSESTVSENWFLQSSTVSAGPIEHRKIPCIGV